MYCLKCGAETPGQQLFCPDCLQSMEAYPVRPDTPVHLPKRQNLPLAKRNRQKEIPPEVQIAKLKGKVKKLTLISFALFLSLLILLGVVLYDMFKDKLPSLQGPGYSVTMQQ